MRDLIKCIFENDYVKVHTSTKYSFIDKIKKQICKLIF